MLGRQQGESGREGFGFATLMGDSVISGVIFFDLEQKVATLTPEALQIFGFKAGHSLNVSFESLPAALVEMARELASSGELHGSRDLSLQVPRRGLIKIRASAIPLRSVKPSGIALVVNDLTAADHFDERIRQLDRLANAGTLAASMAHEIKNALVAGKTFMDLLLEQNQQSELVDVVRREMSRIDAIVGRMLKLARPARTTFLPVHLHQVLEHSIKLVEPHLESKSVSLQQSFEAPLDQVSGDEFELQQAFVNLFLNAFEAMGTEGKLLVASEQVPVGTAASSQAPLIHVTIKDSGPGIPPEHVDHLFEPFFTTKPDGTGLGLAVTRRIFEEHRGSITAESKPTEGASFHILLPIAVTPQ
jgi:signal transduction histidine kinase